MNIRATWSTAKNVCAHAKDLIRRTPPVLFGLAALVMVAPFLGACGTLSTYTASCTAHNEVEIRDSKGGDYLVNFGNNYRAQNATISANVPYGAGERAVYATRYWQDNPDMMSIYSDMGVDTPVWYDQSGNEVGSKLVPDAVRALRMAKATYLNTCRADSRLPNSPPDGYIYNGFPAPYMFTR